MSPGRRTWPIYDAVSVHMVSHRLYQPTWHLYISHLYNLNAAPNAEIIFELGYLTKNEKKRQEFNVRQDLNSAIHTNQRDASEMCALARSLVSR